MSARILVGNIAAPWYTYAAIADARRLTTQNECVIINVYSISCRKTLKVTSLLLPHASGVYQIRCIPTGKIYVGSDVTITNLHEFCRKNGLSFNAMHRLAKGQSKLKAHKGWTHLWLISVVKIVCTLLKCVS